MKRTKKWLACFLCGMLLFSLACCKQNEEESAPSDPRVPSNIGENGTNEAQGLRYTVHRVWVSKELQDNVANSAYVSTRRGEEQAEDGTFTSAHSYVFIDLTVENISFPQPQLFLNMVNLYLYNGNEKLEYGDGYPRTMNYNLEKADDPYFFMIDTYEGQSVRCTLAFVQSDEDLEQATDYYLLLNPFGGEMQKFENEEFVGWVGGTKFIKLNDFVEG